MYQFEIDGIKITSNENLSENEIRNYIRYVKNKNPRQAIESIELTVDGDEIGLGYHLAPEEFEKIRRITGYLVGTMNKWNNAKTAEERDRVKHA